MKKIISLIIALIILSFVSMPMVMSVDTEITGTFTPISTGVSIACNKTAPAFGNINLGENKEDVNFNVTNEGDVNCTVTMTAQDGAGTWIIVAGSSSPATSNQYCINMDDNDTGYSDVYTQKTVSSDLEPAGEWNWTKFDLKVFVSQYTSEGTPGQQTFYANLTASALS